MRNTITTTATTVERGCYVSLELSQKSWVIGILRPGADKVSIGMEPGPVIGAQ